MNACRAKCHLCAFWREKRLLPSWCACFCKIWTQIVVLSTWWVREFSSSFHALVKLSSSDVVFSQARSQTRWRFLAPESADTENRTWIVHRAFCKARQTFSVSTLLSLGEILELWMHVYPALWGCVSKSFLFLNNCIVQFCSDRWAAQQFPFRIGERLKKGALQCVCGLGACMFLILAFVVRSSNLCVCRGTKQKTQTVPLRVCWKKSTATWHHWPSFQLVGHRPEFRSSYLSDIGRRSFCVQSLASASIPASLSGSASKLCFPQLLWEQIFAKPFFLKSCAFPNSDQRNCHFRTLLWAGDSQIRALFHEKKKMPVHKCRLCPTLWFKREKTSAAIRHRTKALVSWCGLCWNKNETKAEFQSVAFGVLSVLKWIESFVASCEKGSSILEVFHCHFAREKKKTQHKFFQRRRSSPCRVNNETSLSLSRRLDKLNWKVCLVWDRCGPYEKDWKRTLLPQKGLREQAKQSKVRIDIVGMCCSAPDNLRDCVLQETDERDLLQWVFRDMLLARKRLSIWYTLQAILCGEFVSLGTVASFTLLAFVWKQFFCSWIVLISFYVYWRFAELNQLLFLPRPISHADLIFTGTIPVTECVLTDSHLLLKVLLVTTCFQWVPWKICRWWSRLVAHTLGLSKSKRHVIVAR